MITTRRSNEYNGYSASDNKGFSTGVDLLERKTPETYNEYITKPVESEEDYLQAKERMQKNLDRLLNYDRYAEISAEEIQVEAVQNSEVTSMQYEDIMPSSTTMQFGDDNFDNVIQDLQKQQESQVNIEFKPKSKGKIVALLYALAVTVVLALIIINTGVLSRLESSNVAKTEILNGKIEQYRVLNEEIDSISSSEYIENLVKNDYGMIKK